MLNPGAPRINSARSVHEALVWDLLDRAGRYLRLKDHNSVRLLLTCDLDPAVAAHDEFSTPALIRSRFSTIKAGYEVGAGAFVEWRIASATAARTGSGVRFLDARHHARGFLKDQFGGDSWPNVVKIRARMVMREPLGVLAIMDGCSDGIVQGPVSYVDNGGFPRYVTDARALFEP